MARDEAGDEAADQAGDRTGDTGDTGDDAVWRAIVDNYGDRAELDPDQHPEPAEHREPAADDPSPVVEPDDDSFVPPDPGPMPRPPRDRALAWAGVFGSPAVILVFVVLGVQPPGLLSYALVAAFVGGFLYLVLRMDREPRDPWDDGAQI